MNEGIHSYRGNVLLLSIVCIISNISYYPIFQASGYGRIAAIAVWILLLFMVASRLTQDWTSTLGRFFRLYCVFAINTMIVGAVNGVNAFDNHFFQIVTIAFLIFLISNRFGQEIDVEDLRMICTAYFYSMAIMAVPLFFVYLRGTDLSSLIYSYQYGKNEIALLLLCALFIGSTIYNPQSTIKKLIRIGAIVFFVVDILFLRTRSALLGIGLWGIVLFLKAKRFRKDVRVLGITAIILIIAYLLTHGSVLDSFLNDIVYAGRDANDLNNLSSGRGDQIAAAWDTFKENVVFGVGDRRTCDSFYFSVLANYGLLGWPLIIMSFIPLIWSIKNFNLYDDVSLCFFLVTASFFLLSLLEELAPFGPGTRCYLLWLMWGVLVQNKARDAFREEIAA